LYFFFQAEDGIRDFHVTGVQTCALPISLMVLKEKFPNYEFSLIMGMDNLKNFHKWKNHEQILKQCSVLVYPRPGFDAGRWENHRSEERRVGKECRSRWVPCDEERQGLSR